MVQQQISDPAKGRYFTQVLNMADDDLNPYQMRLLVHYTRVAWKTGKCWEGIRTTAKITQMSVGMITKTRNELVKLGYIKVRHRKDDTCVIVIVDRMAENVARYAAQDTDDADEFDAPSGKRSSGEQGVHEARRGVHVVNTLEGSSVHVVNERIIEPKELEPRKEETTLHDAIAPRADDWTIGDTSFPVMDDADATHSQRKHVPQGRNTSDSADSSKRKGKATATTAPTTPLPPAAPVEADVQHDTPPITQPTPTKAKRKKSEFSREQCMEMVRELGDAWGVPAAGSDYSLYLKQAQALVKDGIPVEEFKKFCDGRKAKAGAYAPKLSISSVTSGGYVSEYLAQRNEAAQKEAEHKRLIASVPPEYLPKIVPPEERATPEQLAEALALFTTPIFKPSDLNEDAS